MSAAIKDFMLSGWGYVQPAKAEDDAGLGIQRTQRAIWSGLRIIGAVKRKTIARACLKGQMLHRVCFSAALQASALQRSMLKTDIRGVCLKVTVDKLPLNGSCLNRSIGPIGLTGAVLHNSALKARLRGRNSAVIAMALWALLDDEGD